MFEATMTPHVDLGMPETGRVHVAAMHRLPVIAADLPTAWDDCALVQGIDATFRSVADVAVATGAFPGAPAWSPPI